jgi:aryl-alcohol dehydrogenase-like predicted oxidoreductase
MLNYLSNILNKELKMSLPLRKFGNSDIYVTALGYGAGNIGGSDISEDFAGYLLNQVIDLGINFIDTARGYGLSEERIGRHLSWRRNDFILSTKFGYGVEGYQDWTYDCITAGVENALKLMKTDYIDIIHLHSCPRETLEKGEVIAALEKARREGKARIIAYSGENDALGYAVNCARFGSIQCSVNICDQRSLDSQLKSANEKGMGVIAKRPVANAPWLFNERPYGNYCEEYWLRLQKMGLEKGELDWDELAMRFTAYSPGVTTCIAGSTKIANIKRNIDSVGKGGLGPELYNQIRSKFRDNDDNWAGQI